ncbi:MAG: ABC transporter permease subunit [Burkholderiaceae bacterium]
MQKAIANVVRNVLHPTAVGRKTVIGIPYLFLIFFFAVPFLIMLKISLSDTDGIRIKDMVSFSEGLLQFRLQLSSFISIYTAPFNEYIEPYWNSLKFAGITTVICLILGYPFAYFMARAPQHWRPALLMLVMLPFWTSFLLRIYAWKGLLDVNGVINDVLISLGIINEPIHMMHTQFSLIIGMVYAYLPFMILPLYANLVKMDLRLLEAAQDLGATSWKAFWLITVPLSKAGIIAGSMLVFIPCVGEYVIPELLGSPNDRMIGRVIWDEFFGNLDWPRASAVAVIMILLIIVPLAWFNKYQTETASGAAK